MSMNQTNLRLPAIVCEDFFYAETPTVRSAVINSARRAGWNDAAIGRGLMITRVQVARLGSVPVSTALLGEYDGPRYTRLAVAA